MTTQLTIKSIKCPQCGNDISIDIYEWETGTGKPTEAGYHIFCSDSLFSPNNCQFTYEEIVGVSEEINSFLDKQHDL
ncbi:hypothetical protein [Spongiimicrobium salis]|uniref:hypothetical protein n=1 Tax=Spongiimicrobium salis TaxID=1667022 RepID=UPI00374CC611